MEDKKIEEKRYKIGDKFFLMKKPTLGSMQRIQKLIPAELLDKLNTALAWLKVTTEKSAEIFAIILSVESGDKQDILFFETSLAPKDKIIKEIITDFFTLYDPMDFCLNHLTAWSNAYINYPTANSGSEKK